MVNAVRRLPQIPQVGAGQSTQESSSTTGGLFSKLFRKSGNNPNLTEQQIQQQQLQLQQQRLLAQQQLQQQQRGLQSSLSQPQGLASLAGGLAGGGRAGGLAGGGLAGGLAGQQQLLAQQQQLLQQGGLQVQIGFLLHVFPVSLNVHGMTICSGGWKRTLTAAAEFPRSCCPPHPSSPAPQPATAAARRAAPWCTFGFPLDAELPREHEPARGSRDHSATSVSPRRTCPHRCSKRPTCQTNPAEPANPADPGLSFKK